MNARTENAKPPGRPGRITGTAGRVLTRGLLLAAGLATTVLGFSWFVGAIDQVSGYRFAPVCGTAAAAPGTDCARYESGKVTARDVSDGGEGAGDQYWLTVTREAGHRGNYLVSWDFYRATEIGTEVDVALWHGRVAEVSYRDHRAPTRSTPWLTSLEVALLVALGSALTAYGLSWRASPAPAAVAASVALFAFLGSSLIAAEPTSTATALVVPVLGWLGMTAGATFSARED
ncbi:hypothetical protein GCM10018790_73850 [Kitasatospora xanthocidica]|uniref:hypothetical protein n=1 Tax=Kitasatospora xanthocidica TaxID=83382 RepID=UPI00167952B6|nr:hypothetical protein [Kitasatospora xanthocidica]GHF85533.1 hypothetical protein GCM10018790_73850 [Kitasatospora xanthocidica]